MVSYRRLHRSGTPRSPGDDAAATHVDGGPTRYTPLITAVKGHYSRYANPSGGAFTTGTYGQL